MTPGQTPVRSHRRSPVPDTRAGRFALRIGAAGLILALLAVASVITSAIPDTDTSQRPFVRTGAVGSLVDARTLTVTVMGVRGAALIVQDGAAHATTGVWIIVKVRLDARTNPTPLGYVALRDSAGRIYRPTERIDQPFLADGVPVEPGVPVMVEIAFEVPTPVATGLSIQCAGDPSSSGADQRMDALAQIPIPVNAAEVSQWKASKTAATVAGLELTR